MSKFLVAVVAAVVPLIASAGTNLVANGSFEDYNQASSSWKIYSSGYNWTTGVNGIEIRNNVAGKASDGNSYAELDTTANSSIFQDIATVAGQQYLLTFDYSNRTGVAEGSNGLSWSFGAMSGVTPALAYNNSGNNVWSSYSVLVTATSSLTRLSFSAAGTSDSFGSSLDKVSVTTPTQTPVTAVPEPETASLLLAGLGALIIRRRRFNAR